MPQLEVKFLEWIQVWEYRRSEQSAVFLTNTPPRTEVDPDILRLRLRYDMRMSENIQWILKLVVLQQMFTFGVCHLEYSQFNYRPQRSWAKVMFLQASVILLTGGVSVSVHAGIHTPLTADPLGADPPRADPREQTHPPPPEQTPPEADSSIRSTSGRYESYWNAFLL